MRVTFKHLQGQHDQQSHDPHKGGGGYSDMDFRTASDKVIADVKNGVFVPGWKKVASGLTNKYKIDLPEGGSAVVVPQLQSYTIGKYLQGTANDQRYAAKVAVTTFKPSSRGGMDRWDSFDLKITKGKGYSEMQAKLNAMWAKYEKGIKLETDIQTRTT